MDRINKKFISTFDAEVHIYDQWCPTVQRQHGTSIIQTFQTHFGKKQHNKLEQLNCCRVWLGVTMVVRYSRHKWNKIISICLLGGKESAKKDKIQLAESNRYGRKIIENMDESSSFHFQLRWEKLARALGDWLTEGEQSQHWTAYRDEATATLYIAPGGNNSTWTPHKTVTATDQFLIYNHTPGRLFNPPKHAIKNSLHSKTAFTLIYSNSNTAKVSIKSTMKKKENPNNKAMERFMGPLSTKTVSI